MLVKHTFGTQEKRLGSTEGRGGVHWAKDVVGGKRRSRPRRLLSKGVRIYYHQGDARAKAAFNATVGLRKIRLLNMFYRPLAIGTEDGAMTVHYKVENRAIAAELRRFEILGTARRSA